MSSPTNTQDYRTLDLKLQGQERVQSFLENYLSGNPGYNGFDKDILLNDLKLISVSPGESVFELTVRAAHTNGLGNLHGGCAALIFDICTSSALMPMAAEGYWQFVGVTRSLNVTYLRPAPVGTKVLVSSTVIHAGRQLATIRGVMTSKVDGKVVCTAEHTKVNLESPPKQKL